MGPLFPGYPCLTPWWKMGKVRGAGSRHNSALQTLLGKPRRVATWPLSLASPVTVSPWVYHGAAFAKLGFVVHRL